MRTVMLGNKKIGLKASPLALYYYQQEFRKDLLAEFMELRAMAISIDAKNLDLGSFNTVIILQMLYVMQKAAEHGKSFPAFLDWLDDIRVDFTDLEWFTAMMEEGIAGFFPSAGATGEAGGKKAGKAK